MDPDSSFEETLEGPMTIRFTAGASFQEYCATHIDQFDNERFEIVAVRLYYGDEIIVTVYAADRQQSLPQEDGTIPVKKFKLRVDFLKDILPYIQSCNFTLSTGLHPLGNMRIINK